ncbi:MAG: TusE/DsrC/DsvC family sulfur relay protein [Arsenophonus sp.]|nr:MAG: TusE/DsrC/DsvC family sulfur relay protein [Arsenophonus sp.]
MFIFENRIIETDHHGYLKNSQEWKKSMVYLLAKHENIILTEKHWKIILFIRKFYLKFNTSPSMRMLTKAVSKQYGEAVGNSCYLYNLFPMGPAKQATKLAGLPKPIKCI